MPWQSAGLVYACNYFPVDKAQHTALSGVKQPATWVVPMLPPPVPVCAGTGLHLASWAMGPECLAAPWLFSLNVHHFGAVALVTFNWQFWVDFNNIRHSSYTFYQYGC